MTSSPITSPATPPVAVLEQACELVDEVAQTLWAARPGAELTGTVEAIAVLRAKLDAVELAVAREIDATEAGRDAVKQAGWASTKDFLTHISGAKNGAGSAMVRLANRLERHPSVSQALADGWLSRTKAQIVVRAVDQLPADRGLRDRAVVVLLDQARDLSANDLERAGRHVLDVVDPEGVDAALERDLQRAERAAHLNRSLLMRFDRLGGGDGAFNGSVEDLLLLKTVLLSLAAPQPAEPGSCGGDGICRDAVCRRSGHSGRDPRDHGSRMFDALIQLARMAQGSGALPDCHGGVPQVAVTIAYGALRDQVGEATTTLGEDLDAATLRRMACDADLIPGVLGADGAILDAGRLHRLVTAAIWVVLVMRDRHCAFPGCRRPPVMCHAHHIQHWVDGGETKLDNLVLLCGTHHRTIHGTPWEVRLGPTRHPEFRPPGRDDWIRERPPDISAHAA